MTRLRVLVVEDRPDDEELEELLVMELQRGDYDVPHERVRHPTDSSGHQ